MPQPIRNLSQRTTTFAPNMLWFRAVTQITTPAAALEEPLGPVPLTGLRGFLAKFTVLKTARRELWLTFLIKFLIYTAYSITNKTMVLWLDRKSGRVGKECKVRWSG